MGVSGLRGLRPFSKRGQPSPSAGERAQGGPNSRRSWRGGERNRSSWCSLKVLSSGRKNPTKAPPIPSYLHTPKMLSPDLTPLKSVLLPCGLSRRKLRHRPPPNPKKFGQSTDDRGIVTTSTLSCADGRSPDIKEETQPVMKKRRSFPCIGAFAYRDWSGNVI